MNVKFFFFTFALFVTLLLVGCGAANAAVSVPLVPAGARAGELTEMQDCEYQPLGNQTKFSAKCGTLVVPENWDKTDARLLALPVVRVLATGAKPAEPIFFLQGGPGQSNLSWGPPAWLLDKHDVVFVGYRGIDGSVTLTCPEVGRLLKAHLGKDLLSGQARAEFKVAVRECAARHQSAGVDLAGYTVSDVIQDMEAARVALGYPRVNLLSESYGTRVAQLYAYMYPDSLHRLVLIAVNTPGRFIWDPASLDERIEYISALCAKDASCSRRTSNLARTMYDVNRNMPTRWLIFDIDPDTVRYATQFMFFDNPNMPLVFDAYLAAAEGDPSGLAMLNLLATIAPVDQLIFGDLLSKAGTLDLEKYRALGNVGLGDSIMGAPLTEWIWPLVEEWQIELAPKHLREFQSSNVEMLLVNGAVDFSTPPSALAQAKPYYRNAQMVLLPEFSHVADVMATLQPKAFERLVTSYYDTGVADSGLYVYEPLSFSPSMSLTLMAKGLVFAMIIAPALLVLGIVFVVRRFRRRRVGVTLSDSVGAFETMPG